MNKEKNVFAEFLFWAINPWVYLWAAVGIGFSYLVGGVLCPGNNVGCMSFWEETGRGLLIIGGIVFVVCFMMLWIVIWNWSVKKTGRSEEESIRNESIRNEE